MTWQVSARNRSGLLDGVVDVFDKLTIVERHLGLGTWVLEIPLDNDMVPYLVAPGAGVQVKLDGLTVMSGPHRAKAVTIDGSNRSLVLAGVSDLTVLADRRVHPQPGSSAPPYSSTAYDVRTGPAETVVKEYVDVNAGPGAIVTRRRTGFTVTTSAGTGATVTGRGRWHQLLPFVVELCVLGGIGIRCVDLTFDTYNPVDRSATVEFSDARESVASISYEDQAPEATYVYVGGGGEGVSRTILEAQNAEAMAAGWDRIETFADRRDTTDTTELAQAATLALIGEASTDTERVGVKIVPIDVENTAYRTDYYLGDTVSYVDPFGTKSTKTVQAVTTEITPSVTTVAPTLGTIEPDVQRQFSRLQSLARRTARLEVR